MPTQTTGTAVDVNAPKGPMQPDVQETETAAAAGKPALLYFYWPNPEDPAGDACRELDAKIWVDGKVCNLAQKYVCIKVNGKTCPKQVLARFGVTSYPMIIFQICTKKVVTRVKSKCVEPKAFAKAMESVLKSNDRMVKLLEARQAKLDKQVESASKLLESGNLTGAERAFRRLLKEAPGSEQAAVAQSGLAEVACRRNLAKGRKLLKRDKFAEARSLLQLAAECEVPCEARDLAQDLLPDCAFGLQYTEACQKLAAGDNPGAMEAFTKIAGDTCYEGKFKQLAEKKLQEMKDAWDKRTRG